MRVLVLCPPNITAPNGGPCGVLGDRLHQLPSLRACRRLFPEVVIWPRDPITEQIFGGPFLADETEFDRAICLFADPAQRPADCAQLVEAVAIARRVATSRCLLPARIDPRGERPVWRQLLDCIAPADDLTLPVYVPSEAAKTWAARFLTRIARDREVLLLSPFSGAPKYTVSREWWRALAGAFAPGIVLVPVQESEEPAAAEFFRGVDNVVIVVADIPQTAALAATPGLPVIGTDGGRLTLMAAARSEPVTGLFGLWPASAWAFPNVLAGDPRSTPEEALRNLSR